MTGDAKSQNYENARVQFTAIIWQKTQINKIMRTFEFNYKILMRKTLRFCAVMLPDLAMETSVNQ